MSSDLFSLENMLAKYNQNRVRRRVVAFKRHLGTQEGYR